MYKTKPLVYVANSIWSILAQRQGMTILGYLTLEFRPTSIKWQWLYYWNGKLNWVTQL